MTIKPHDLGDHTILSSSKILNDNNEILLQIWFIYVLNIFTWAVIKYKCFFFLTLTSQIIKGIYMTDKETEGGDYKASHPCLALHSLFLMSLARVVFCAVGCLGNNRKYCTHTFFFLSFFFFTENRFKRCGSLGFRQFLYTSIGLK